MGAQTQPEKTEGPNRPLASARDLFRVANQSRSRATAHKTNPGPKVRGDFQLIPPTAVQPAELHETPYSHPA